MPTMPATFRPGGARTRAEVKREADTRRGSARERGYDTAWDKASKAHLREHPLCGYCEADAWGEGARVSPAGLVDHLYPHKGDRTVFWARGFWVSACADCHNGPKQRAERQGRAALDHLARRLGLAPLRA